MPAKTEPTPERVVEILAVDGMGWYRRGSYWFDKKGKSQPRTWNPLADLNIIRNDLEERLTEEQRHSYLRELITGRTWTDGWWIIRHADARTCAYALARVFRLREFE
jgi:hypothetical protein